MASQARNVLALSAAGGNVCYRVKFAGIFGLDVQDIGAQQTGMSKGAVAVDQDLSWHLIEQLVAEDFDLVSCQEMLVDHAVTNPMQLLYPDQAWGIRILPICINTVQFPLSSARRRWALGEGARRVHERDHIPMSNTASGVLATAPAA